MATNLQTAGEHLITAVRARMDQFSNDVADIKNTVDAYKASTTAEVETGASSFNNNIASNDDSNNAFHDDFRKEVADVTYQMQNGSEDLEKSLAETNRFFKYQLKDLGDWSAQRADRAKGEVEDTRFSFGDLAAFEKEFNAVLFPVDPVA